MKSVKMYEDGSRGALSLSVLVGRAIDECLGETVEHTMKVMKAFRGDACLVDWMDQIT
jgi:hypothetical protein